MVGSATANASLSQFLVKKMDWVDSTASCRAAQCSSFCFAAPFIFHLLIGPGDLIE